MAEGVKGVSLVVQNDKEMLCKRHSSDAVVESCAEIATRTVNSFLGSMQRSLGLGATGDSSITYDGQDQPVARDIAEHNRRAIMKWRHRLSNPVRSCLDHACTN